MDTAARDHGHEAEQVPKIRFETRETPPVKNHAMEANVFTAGRAENRGA